MNDSKLYLHGKYLASLMGSSIRGEAPEKAPDNINWDFLYELATKHNVISLIYSCIRQSDVPEETLRKFDYDNHRFIAREARQEIEARRVFTALNKNNIKFIKLKGIVIKNLYPVPYMRTSSDVDICMTKEDRLRSRDIMQELGYTLNADIDYNDEYSKDNFFIYELHSSVVSSHTPYAKLFTDPFSKAVKDSDGVNYVLDSNYFYLHTLVHLIHHFLSGGCGIRQLCDLYVLEKSHPDTDMEYISAQLDSCGLLTPFNTFRTLSFSLFEGNELSKEQSDIAEFIFKCGEYGNSTLKHISWLSEEKQTKWSTSKKIKYFLKLWFPGVKTLKRRYPVLEKAPFLLPVCWIRRIFYVIFFNRNALKEQRDEIRKLNSDELKEAERVRNLAGISLK